MPKEPKEPRGPQASVRFYVDELKRLRRAAQLTQEGLAGAAGISAFTYRRHAERGEPVSEETAREIGRVLCVDYKTISTPVEAELRTPRFKLMPIPNIGMNIRPHPSSVDDDKGYQFMGKYTVESKIDCEIMKIALTVTRNDHIAICCGPGKASYHNGTLPGEARAYGYVRIDSEENYVDADCRFLKLVKVAAGKKFIVSISRWCRAIGQSRQEPETLSIYYWIDDPTQIVTIEFTHADRTYAEDHTFKFDGNRMVLDGVRIRPIT